MKNIQRHPMSLDDLFAGFHSIGKCEISPDGQLVIYEYQGGLWSVDRADNNARLTDGSMPRWSPTADEFAFLRGNPAQLWIRSGDSIERQVTFLPRRVKDYDWAFDGERFALITPGEAASAPITASPSDPPQSSPEPGDQLWLVTIATGEAQFIAGAPPGIEWSCPSVHPHQPWIALEEFGYFHDGEHVTIINYATGTQQRAVNNPNPSSQSPRWAPDGRQLAFLYSPHDYWYPLQCQCAVVSICPDGDLGEMEHFGEGYYIEEASGGRQLYWQADSQAIYTIGIHGATKHILRVDLVRKEVQQLTHQPGWLYRLRLSRDGNWLACTYSAPDCLGELHVYPKTGGEPQVLVNVDAQWNHLQLGETELVHWHAPDGLELEGVLIKPLNYEPGRKYPLLVDLHGGPAPGGTAFFKRTWHWLAAQGYFVFSPDFRTGQTYEWVEPPAEHLDFSDIMSGLDALVARGDIHPDRLGAFGFSYGADLLSWILGHSDRFRAAVVTCGGFDPCFICVTKDTPNPPQTTTPTLFQTGDKDLPHIQKVHDWLQQAGVEVKLVHYQGEGHGFSKRENEYDWLGSMLAWFDHYLQS
jgi:dipeptidyl aminopeptidase/acylaminoacyl peptidase